MMHPQAATAYLGPQNSVADDFIASLPQHLDANKELNDLSAHLLNYTIEGMHVLIRHLTEVKSKQCLEFTL
jgi:hypothetical protein